MGATILSRTVSSVEDKRARLGNASFARSISIGNSWTKLRIGLRLTFENTGVNITSTPVLAIGVCSGVTNIYGDGSVTNFAGVLSTAALWTWGSSTPSAWYNSSTTWYPAKKVGTTQTLGATPIPAAPGPYFAAVPDYRDVIFVDIQKGSPNYSFWVFWSSFLADISIANFKTQMEAATPVLSNHTYSGPQTLAVDESAGNFDTICVHWNHTCPAVEISDWAICKLS